MVVSVVVVSVVSAVAVVVVGNEVAQSDMDLVRCGHFIARRRLQSSDSNGNDGCIIGGGGMVMIPCCRWNVMVGKARHDFGEDW